MILSPMSQKEKEEAKKIAPVALSMIDDYKEFLSGGKKLRGGGIFLGFQMFGGEDEKTVRISKFVGGSITSIGRVW